MVHRICQEKSLSFFIISIIADYFEPSIIEEAGGSIRPLDEGQLSTSTDVDYDAILDIIVSVPHRTYHEITDFH
jgi:hypothetical protein